MTSELSVEVLETADAVANRAAQAIAAQREKPSEPAAGFCSPVAAAILPG